MRTEHATGRDVERRWRLGDGLARPAREALADCFDDLVLGRDGFQRPGDGLTQLAEIVGPAARACLGGGDDDALDRQVVGEFPARAALAGKARDGRGRLIAFLSQEV
jgi:hypothetical protein